MYFNLRKGEKSWVTSDIKKVIQNISCQKTAIYFLDEDQSQSSNEDPSAIQVGNVWTKFHGVNGTV